MSQIDLGVFSEDANKVELGAKALRVLSLHLLGG